MNVREFRKGLVSFGMRPHRFFQTDGPILRQANNQKHSTFHRDCQSVMRRAALCFVLAAMLFVGTTTCGLAERRVALVIGNSNYQHAPILRNPTNDSREISASLTRLGFDVSVARDLGIEAMRQALKVFSNDARGADVALIFFAGHGIEFNKQNYLIPTDAELKSDTDIQYEAISLDLAMRAVENAKGLRIVLLDACRNNPFIRSMKKTLGTRSVGRGLVKVEPSVGTLIGYAAKEGTTADDGIGSHSPFTQGLLKYIEQPGLEIQFMFRKVRDHVLKTTNGRQEPFAYGSLPGRQIFLKPPTASKTDEANIEVAYWNSVRETGDEVLLKTYLKRFPGGQFATLATIMIDRIRQQQEAKKRKKPKPPSANSQANFDPSIQVPLLSGKALVLRIQQELKRLGCYPGTIDGAWGPKSRDALWAFTKHGNYRLTSSSEPNSAVLEAVIRRRTRVCPLECGPRFDALSDKCVLKTCPRGNSLSAAGRCVKDQVSTRALSKRVQFYSDVRAQRWNATVYGELTKPKGTAPFPAVVLLNNCNDTDLKDVAAMREHARFLSRSGFVTLLLDSYRGRNLSNGAGCGDDEKLWRASRFFRGGDAYNGSEYLRQREYVDASNIFLLGGGVGGSAAFRVAFGDHTGHAPFQAVAALYPWCDKGLTDRRLKTHLLVILGAKDTISLPSQCTAIKTNNPARAAEFDVVVLRGAYYAFDIRWGKHRWKKHWLGFNAKATSQSRREILDFFKSHLAN